MEKNTVFPKALYIKLIHQDLEGTGCPQLCVSFCSFVINFHPLYLEDKVSGFCFLLLLLFLHSPSWWIRMLSRKFMQYIDLNKIILVPSCERLSAKIKINFYSLIIKTMKSNVEDDDLYHQSCNAAT